MEVLEVLVDFGEFQELEVAERFPVFVELDQKMVADQSHHHHRYLVQLGLV